jgi:hypothetical protein
VGADPLTTDPLALVLDAVVRQRATVEAAELMGSAAAWAGVLGRGWDDGGQLLDGLVRSVAEAPAGAARTALHGALLAIGAGLEDSDPADWPVDLHVVDGAAAALSTAVARHVDDVRAALAAAAAGVAAPEEATVLRGLSVVLDLHDEAEDAIASALAPGGRHPSAMPPGAGIGSSVVVTTALAAVAEHGRRLTGAMQEHEEKRRAEGRALLWDMTFGIPISVAGLVPLAGRVTGVVESVVTRLLGTNGYHVNDLQLDETGAFRSGGGAAGPRELTGRDRQALLETGLRAFLTTRDALGDIRLPDETDPGVLRDLAAALAGDVAGGAITRQLRDHPLLGEGVGAVVGDEVAGSVRGR